MHTHRIEVLNRADDDDVVGHVAHHFHLVFLPPDDALFQQHLVNGRQFQSLANLLVEFLAIVGNPAADSTQREAGTNDDRQADVVQRPSRFVHVVNDVALADLQADLDHRLLERIAFFRLGDDTGLGSDHLNAKFFQHAVPGQIHANVERRLATECRQNRIRPFNLDDFRHVLPRDRFNVGAIRHLRIGHDRCGVGIDQHHLITLFTQGFAGLSAGIVKLAGLADDDRTGTNDQNLLKVVATRHGGIPCCGAGKAEAGRISNCCSHRANSRKKHPRVTCCGADSRKAILFGLTTPV